MATCVRLNGGEGGIGTEKGQTSYARTAPSTESMMRRVDCSHGIVGM
jgi:hypothetical protein